MGRWPPGHVDELVHVYGPFDLEWIRRTTASGVEVNLLTYLLLPEYYVEVEGKRYCVTKNIMRDVHIVGPVDRDHWAEVVWARAEDGEKILLQYNRTIVRDENGTVVTRISNGSCPLGAPKPTVNLSPGVQRRLCIDEMWRKSSEGGVLTKL